MEPSVHVSAIPEGGQTATSHAVTVVDPVFHDPKGARLRV